MPVQIECAYCGTISPKWTGAVNRSRALGAPLYCSRKCAGLARRKPPKSLEQRKAEKKAYDAVRRILLLDEIKEARRAYYQRTRDPVKEAIKRKARMPAHVEYCRRPEYRAWKREYDKQYCAKKEFGEFWESAILVNEIRDTALSLSTDYQIRLANGTLNKALKRKRSYAREIYREDDDRDGIFEREEPQGSALADLERREGRRHAARTS